MSHVNASGLRLFHDGWHEVTATSRGASVVHALDDLSNSGDTEEIAKVLHEAANAIAESETREGALIAESMHGAIEVLREYAATTDDALECEEREHAADVGALERRLDESKDEREALSKEVDALRAANASLIASATEAQESVNGLLQRLALRDALIDGQDKRIAGLEAKNAGLQASFASALRAMAGTK